MINLVTVCALLLCAAGSAIAQISPGELSAAHADLEGIANCTKCHERKGGDSPHKKCLSCHAEVEVQIREHRGFHWHLAKAQGKRDCRVCHSEHNGRGYELVYWEGGTRAFDHGVTGYTLEGKHRALECRACHKPEFVGRELLALNAKIDPARTFLGLGRECLDCHKDFHQGQFTGSCTGCHTQEQWKPATGFAHEKTDYPLTGKHADVACRKCHRTLTGETAKSAGGDTLRVRYTGLEFGDCVSCHRTAHRTKLGPRCDGCHTTAAWREVKVSDFDHAKTAYPLEGRHRALACEKCHRERAYEVRIKFDMCTDCHKDVHERQFAGAPYNGRCESCHSVERFLPVRYDIAEHDSSDYPLTGAHRAVPCVGCHPKNEKSGVVKFRMEFGDCRDCHADEHAGQFDRRMAEKDCRVCHDIENWKSVEFSHDDTRFPLDGKHRDVKCAECHPGVRAASGREYTLYRDVPRTCKECHPSTAMEISSKE
jgi:hypothetical protein